jgi:DNA-binding NarL/FixJ family response regulator
LHVSQRAAELAQAMERATNQRSGIPTSVVAGLLARQLRQEGSRITAEGVEALTARELEVLMLMGQGFDNRQLATELGISYATVRNHVRNLMGKLGVHSKLHAVVRARQLGLLGDRSWPFRLPGTSRPA